jgi:hypothetical protein
MTSASKYLATYLNDHLGGATAGVELVRRAARENEGSELGAFLSELAEEIAADRHTLEAIMGELGVKPDRAKVAAGWAVEKVGRLKPNAQLRGYSPLSPLVELEGLLVGIQGKLAMWRALAEIADAVGLDRVRLEALAARAEGQQADVERHRLEVARQALTAV